MQISLFSFSGLLFFSCPFQLPRSAAAAAELWFCRIERPCTFFHLADWFQSLRPCSLRSTVAWSQLPPKKKWYREPGSWWNIKSSKNKPLRERSPTTTTTRTVQMEYLRTYFYPLNDKGFRSFAITTVRGLVEDEFAKSEQPSKMMISTSSAETLSTAMSFWPLDVVGP